MDYFKNVEIVDLYKGVGLRDLLLSFLVQVTERHYRCSSISQLYGTAIEAAIPIDREEVENIANELDHYGLAHRCCDGETIGATTKGLMDLRRN